MKKTSAILLSLLLMSSFALASCGESGSESNDKLSIVESGWSYDKGGYVYYSISLKNESSDKVYEFPSFRITAYDKNEEVLGTTDQTIGNLNPGDTATAAFMGPDVSSKPEKVEIDLINNDDSWVSPDTSELPNFKKEQLTTEKLKRSKDEWGDTKFTGIVKNNSEYDLDNVAVFVVFRDKDGNMIGGDDTFIDDVKSGKSTPFEIDTYFDWATDDYEIHCLPWL